MRNCDVELAGKPTSIDDVMTKLEKYPKRTIAVYDRPGPGIFGVISTDEIKRTRAVSSRISEYEGAWFARNAEGAPWISEDSDLADADPATLDGTYRLMTELYDHFRNAAPRGIAVAKISKVLHLKYPCLYPILDSRLLKAYRSHAIEQAQIHRSYGYRRMYWPAIRNDLVANRESGALAAVLVRIGEHHSPGVRDIAELSDLRILDILTWR